MVWVLQQCPNGELADPIWGVGLARASDLAGQWKRCSQLNPVPLDKVFAENPIVMRLRDGLYIFVFDTFFPDGIAYSVFRDGIHWPPTRHVVLERTKDLWVKDVRTPLGLVDEGYNEFTLFYTSYAQPRYYGYGCMGLVTIKLE